MDIFYPLEWIADTITYDLLGFAEGSALGESLAEYMALSKPKPTRKKAAKPRKKSATRKKAATTRQAKPRKKSN